MLVEKAMDLLVECWKGLLVVTMSLLASVDDPGTTDLAVTLAVGNEKDVVGWSLGPPQLTTHASIVSKLFSLP